MKTLMRKPEDCPEHKGSNGYYFLGAVAAAMILVVYLAYEYKTDNGSKNDTNTNRVSKDSSTNIEGYVRYDFMKPSVRETNFR